MWRKKKGCNHGKWRGFRLVQMDNRSTLELATLEYEGVKVQWWRCRVCGSEFPEEVSFFSGACMFGASAILRRKERNECIHLAGIRGYPEAVTCASFGSATEVTLEDIERGQPGEKCTFDAQRICPLYLRNEARIRGPKT